MAIRTSLANLLYGKLPTSAPSTATGYSTANLTDNVMARPWKSSASATSFSFYYDLTTSPPAIDYAAAFDARASTGGVTGIKVYSSADGVTYALRATIGPNSRGDGCKGFPAVSARYWWIEVLTSVSATLSVGLLWLGVKTDLSKSYSVRQQDQLRNTVVNETEGGGVFVARLASYRRKVALVFSPLTAAQSDSVQVAIDSLDGAFNSLVLQPDSATESDVLHGRLANDAPWEFDGLQYTGRLLDFTESGRAL